MSENGSYFYHALRVDRNVCTGCTHCLRSCPTEAIRIRKGKAVIYNNKCIDCGECFKACPIHAIYIKQDDFELLDDYKYRIALVPATFIGQFPNNVKTSQIYACLKKIGFTHTYEVEHAVSFLIELYKQYMAEHDEIDTFISPYCPAIVRLIQVRFPSLVHNIIHLSAPLDIASIVIRQRLVEAGIPSEDIGIFYVSPCAAKIAAVKSPAEGKKSFITGVINMDFLYNKVKLMLSNSKSIVEPINHSLTGNDVLWGLTTGESRNFNNSCFAVDGIRNAIEFLEKVEDEDISANGLVEMRACDQSCVGGVLCPTNRFVAKQKLKARAEIIDSKPKNEDSDQKVAFNNKEFAEKIAEMVKVDEIKPRSILKLNDNLQIAFRMVENMKRIEGMLPGIDCSACGAPTCNALAEDVIRNESKIENCIFAHKKMEEFYKVMFDIWGEDLKTL